MKPRLLILDDEVHLRVIVDLSHGEVQFAGERLLERVVPNVAHKRDNAQPPPSRHDDRDRGFLR